jgi:hypothetical protein
MAKYQITAMLNAPSKEGYDEISDPKAYGDYKVLETAFEYAKSDIMRFILENYRYDGGPIEEHKRIDADFFVEGNEDCFCLLERVD